MTPTGVTPVTVLTGFLGSGKSTLLNRLLREPGMEPCAVIINEWGSVSIDHALVRPRLPLGLKCAAKRAEFTRSRHYEPLTRAPKNAGRRAGGDRTPGERGRVGGSREYSWVQQWGLRASFTELY